MKTKRLFRAIEEAAIVIVAVTLLGLTALGISSCSSSSSTAQNTAQPAVVTVFAPLEGDDAGQGGFGWFVDLAVDFNLTPDKTGFTGNQLTGPAGHDNIPPMPGAFGPGRDDRFQGLVVLLSTSSVGAGPGQNLANLFNLTGISRMTSTDTQIWDTWIVAAPNFGANVNSTLYVAVVNDLNGDGIYNDAPDTVPDSNNDGKVDGTDLAALGLASNTVAVNFTINP